MEPVDLTNHLLSLNVPNENIDEFGLSLHGHLARSGNLSIWMEIKANYILLMILEELLFVQICVHGDPQCSCAKDHL